VGTIDAIDVMESVANEADGLGTDPGTDRFDAIDANAARKWLQHPQVEIVEE
jgi:hypothetical protein